MAYASVDGVVIRGVSSAVPNKVRFNADIGSRADLPYVQRLSDQVGVRQRRIADVEQFGSDLAVSAFESLLKSLSWDERSIDLLIVATQTPDRLFPGIAFQIHRKCQLRSDIPVFDVNLGCSGFTHGLWIASSLLNKIGSRAVLINVDTMSRTLDASDIGNQVLFGDAAAATALEVDPNASKMHFEIESDGSGSESVCFVNSGMKATQDLHAHFFINGPAVLGLAVRKVPKLVNSLLENSKINASDVGFFVPHQANKFILEKMPSLLNLTHVTMANSMDSFGNTSSASIPLALTSIAARQTESSLATTLLVGFGTGFSLSAVIADLRSSRFIEPVDVV